MWGSFPKLGSSEIVSCGSIAASSLSVPKVHFARQNYTPPNKAMHRKLDPGLRLE